MSNRREFITLIGVVAAAWPVAAGAQQSMRRIGVFLSLSQDDPQGQARLFAFQESLRERGWVAERNVQFEIRWGAGDRERIRRYAEELAALRPDVTLASGGVTMQALHQITRSLPIVFASVLDPVGAGYVESLSHPGGNATGFTLFEYDIGAKWLELLKETVPSITRVAVIRDATATSGTAQFAAIRAVSPYLRVDITPVDTRNAGEIEHAVKVFAEKPNGGLIVVGGASATVYRDTIIKLTQDAKLPAIYFDRVFVVAGGLLSYGPDQIEPHRRAAAYVDRLLKGEKPRELPVQASTKYETIVNLKTARALGLDVPPTLLARADEVID